MEENEIFLGIPYKPVGNVTDSNIKMNGPLLMNSDSDVEMEEDTKKRIDKGKGIDYSYPTLAQAQPRARPVVQSGPFIHDLTKDDLKDDQLITRAENLIEKLEVAPMNLLVSEGYNEEFLKLRLLEQEERAEDYPNIKNIRDPAKAIVIRLLGIDLMEQNHGSLWPKNAVLGSEPPLNPAILPYHKQSTLQISNGWYYYVNRQIYNKHLYMKENFLLETYNSCTPEEKKDWVDFNDTANREYLTEKAFSEHFKREFWYRYDLRANAPYPNDVHPDNPQELNVLNAQDALWKQLERDYGKKVSNCGMPNPYTMLLNAKLRKTVDNYGYEGSFDLLVKAREDSELVRKAKKTLEMVNLSRTSYEVKFIAQENYEITRKAQKNHSITNKELFDSLKNKRI